MWRHVLVGLIAVIPSIGITQNCAPGALRLYQVRAFDTDPTIDIEVFKHFAWVNPDCTPKNLLLVHLCGTLDNPFGTTYFPELAANHGFHVVSLKYPNLVSGQTPCRNSDDADCYSDFRNEIIEGVDYSPYVDISTSNSIQNRLLKLLIYLDSNHPVDGWDSYYSGSTLNWNLMVVSGHSQGGGHAAIIAKQHRVNRVIMFASPNDYSDFFDGPASWVGIPGETPDSAYFSFGNLYDDIVDFSEQYVQWNDLGLSAFGDTVQIDHQECPYFNSHQLYTTEETQGLAGNHSNMIRDNETPLEMGLPVYAPVWKYLLGISCATSGVSEPPEQQNVKIYPNPFRGQTTLVFDNSNHETHSLLLITSAGKVVLAINEITTEQLVINASQLGSGFYLYQLWKNDRVVSLGKLLIQ